eukprot:3309312-Prorocentrum_lima.AAC.1
MVAEAQELCTEKLSAAGDSSRPSPQKLTTIRCSQFHHHGISVGHAIMKQHMSISVPSTQILTPNQTMRQ